MTTTGAGRRSDRPEDRESRRAAPADLKGTSRRRRSDRRSAERRPGRRGSPGRRGTPMLDRQTTGRGTAGPSALLLAVVFLGLSLAGYDPADPPGRAAEPANDPPANPCGPVGATLAHVLFARVGWSSYLVLFALGGRRPARLPPPAGPRAGPPAGSASRWSSLVAAALVQKFGPGLEPEPAGRQRRLPRGARRRVPRRPVRPGRDAPDPRGRRARRAWSSATTSCSSGRSRSVRRSSGGCGRRRRPADVAGRRAGGTSLMLAAPSLRGASARPTLPRRRSRPARPAIAPTGLAAERRTPRPRPEPAVRPPSPATASARPPAAGRRRGSSSRRSTCSSRRPPFPVQEHEAKIHARAMLLERTLLDFGYQVRVVQIDTGPVITQFEIELEAGLRVSQDHQPGRRPGDRPGRAERPDRGADPGQDDRRHRGPQRAPRRWSGSARSIDGRRRAAREVPDPAVPRQGRQGGPARVRPGRHAPPADRRPDRARASRSA